MTSRIFPQLNNCQTVLISPLMTLYLPAPEFENSDRNSYTRINHRSRGGDLYIFREGYWPKTKTLSLPLGLLLQSQREDLIRFAKLTIGQIININTHDYRAYRGILHPDLEITTPDKFTSHVVLQFECLSTLADVYVMKEQLSAPDYHLTFQPKNSNYTQIFLNGLLEINYTIINQEVVFDTTPEAGDIVIAIYVK